MYQSIALVLFGCSQETAPEPHAPTDATDEVRDADGDGFASASDCDDEQASVHPGAQEICDGLDNDCDSEVDEAPAGEIWYADVDDDGFGDPASTLLTCETAPLGYVANAADCDDTDPVLHDETVWHHDSDGDGFGQDVSGTGCTSPGVLAGGDCDDNDELIHPDADEVCDNVDNDCDGDVDGDALDNQTWYADVDGDGWGDPDSAIEACWQPSDYDLQGHDCDDGNEAIHPGAPEVCEDGIDWDCTGDPSNGCLVYDMTEPGFMRVLGEDGSGEDVVKGTLGQALASPGDIDKDGFDDLLAGVPAFDNGQVWAIHGPLSTGDQYMADVGEPLIEFGEGTSMGWGLLASDDVTGDGEADLAVFGLGYLSQGRVEVYTGPLSSPSFQASFEGEGSWDRLGDQMVTTDIDADGQLDLLLSAPKAAGSSYDEGAVYVFAGPVSGEIAPSSAVATFYGATGDHAGSALATWDHDGDGIASVVVGAEGADGDAGAAAIVDPTTWSGSIGAGDADILIHGMIKQDSFGGSASVVGDTDGDGRDDLAVAARTADAKATNGGGVFLFTSSLTGDIGAEDADAMIFGDTDLEHLGDVMVGRDLDGDGHSDLVVGGTAYTTASGGPGHVGTIETEGTVYAFYGPLPVLRLAAGADVRFTLDERTSGLVDGADLDGDGTSDLAIGAADVDSGMVVGIPATLF